MVTRLSVGDQHDIGWESMSTGDPNKIIQTHEAFAGSALFSNKSFVIIEVHFDAVPEIMYNEYDAFW